MKQRLGALALTLAIGACSQAALAQPPVAQTARARTAHVQAVMLQVQALQRALAPHTPAEAKIAPGLLDTVRTSEGHPLTAVVPTLRPKPKLAVDAPIRITVKGRVTPDLVAFVRSLGASDVAAAPDVGELAARVPLSHVRDIAARPEVTSVALAGTPITRQNTPSAGLQDPEGDIAHAAAAARTTYGVDGTGVKICVISNSADYLTAAQTNQSLGSVTVVQGEDNDQYPTNPKNPKGWGEGTAMLEIIHRIAPGASLEFATGSVSDVGMQTNIATFISDSCNIIVDDIGYSNEPIFQDGILSQAVTDASNAGILFFSAAGNDGNILHNESSTWAGPFRPAVVAPGETQHMFSDDLPVAYAKIVNSNVECVNNAPVAGGPRLILWWSDPLGASTHQFKLMVFDSEKNLRGFAVRTLGNAGDPEIDIQICDGDMIELLGVGNWPPINLRMAMGENAGFAQPVYGLTPGTAGAIYGHSGSGAANLVSVGAKDAEGASGPFVAGQDQHVESFSSDGVVTMFYKPDGTAFSPPLVLNKPDLTAADCVTTDVPGFDPFCGTSAAAPQAAGIAALIWEHLQQPTAAKTRAAMRYLDIEAPGWDPDSGNGILMPGPSLGAAP